MKRTLLAVCGVGVFAAGPASAQDAASDEQVVKREEVVVVSASKVESTLINAPATLSVVTPDMIEASPAQNYGDLLRSVPGLNVIQTSARDINMTSRQSTSTLVNSQLVLLDGRSIYLDFFGLVLWDFVPTSSNEIRQIEVVRGPASAVWGANALTGVVNVITKNPREAEGLTLNFSGGLFNRDGGSREADGEGTQFGGNFSYANAPNDTLSYRLAAGYFNSDPYSRPVGTIPRTTHPLDSRIQIGGASYPSDQSGRGAFSNAGTSQPRADLRIDQETSNGGRITYQGGYAGTKGIIHTGIGPFDIESGSYMTYGKVGYAKGAFKLNFFANLVDVKAPNLLNVDPDTGGAVRLNFNTQTFDLEVGNSNVIGGKHILSYGGNARRNNFDITLTPQGQDRNEFGAYFQEEFFLEKFRIAAGLRVDKFGNIDDPVLSPRLSVMLKPTPDHSIRVSFNRAFRAPSVVNNYLDQDIFVPDPLIDLRPLAAALPPPLNALVPNEPFLLRVKNVGNPNLEEEALTAYELAYTGVIGRKTTLGLAVYRNDQSDNINFVTLLPSPEFPQGLPGLDFYSAQDPARGIGAVTGTPIQLNPTLMTILATLPPQVGGPIRLPRTASTYLNLGPIRNEGLEASIEHSFTSEVSGFANYSYQRRPKVLDPDPNEIPYPASEVGIPSKNRFNAGVNLRTDRLLASASVNHASEALWVDVLTPVFHGFTDAYTMVNATLGVRWADGRVTTSLKGTNLFNQNIQQHIYGDLIKRSLVAEVRVSVK